MSRASSQAPLIPDGGPPHCPACREPLRFECDRQGRIVEHCDCGYRGFVVRRGDTTTPAPREAR